MMDNQETEFEWFERLRGRLNSLLLNKGYGQQAADELSFLIMQGVRDVPRFINILEESDKPSDDEVMDALYDVLTNAVPLGEAASVLIPKNT